MSKKDVASGNLENVCLDTDVVEKIYQAYEKASKQRRSQRLGLSAVGKECERAIWYDFRWSAPQEDIPGRILRLFETGNLEEPRMIADLRSIGCEVKDVDPRTGKQFFVEALGGHFVGFLDGVIVQGVPDAPSTPHLLEMKTLSAKNFRAVVKHGLQKAQPTHYAQVQGGMSLSVSVKGAKTQLTRALYLAKNKDTEELYAERVRFDAEYAVALKAKARRVIFSDEPPERISDNPDYFQCRFCAARPVCHEGELPEINCRTCAHVTAAEGDNGAWTCGKKDNRTIPIEVQRKGCSEHIFNPYTLPYGQPERAEPDESAVYYRDKDGNEIVNRAGKGIE